MISFVPSHAGRSYCHGLTNADQADMTPWAGPMGAVSIAPLSQDAVLCLHISMAVMSSSRALRVVLRG